MQNSGTYRISVESVAKSHFLANHRPNHHTRHIGSRIQSVQSDIVPLNSQESRNGGGDTFVPPLTAETWESFLKPYKSAYDERAMFITKDMIQGEIPKELKGTLLRNGPGLFEIGGKKIPQPFDGDGKAAMFCFGDDNEVYFSTRFVRTKAFVEEQQANKMLYRGAFSVGNPAGGLFYNPFDLSVKQIANTGIVHWAGKILALYERDIPYHLGDGDLKTVGTTTLDGAIDEPYFAAHNCITNEPDGSRRLVTFSASEKGLDNRIVVWEYSEAGEQLSKVEVTLPNAAFGFFHDLAVTESHYIFVENPVQLNMKKFLLEYMFGKACIAECLDFVASKQTKIHVIPRPGKSKDEMRTFLCPDPFFTFHHVNAFETKDGNIILDTCALHEGMDFSANFETTVEYYNDNVGRGAYTRLFINTSTGSVTQKKLMDRACDFPCVAPSTVGIPHKHAYVYGSAADQPDLWGPPQVISKVTFDDVESTEIVQQVFHPGKDRWAQEPIFVPRDNGSAEDDGWVLVIVYDAVADASELVILDARTMTPEATIKLPFFIPPGLHGSFTRDYLGPDQQKADAMKGNPTLYDIRRGIDY
jgi:all-trans-8'-apo-beta-carotenal 15,15'-oxygenase